MPALRLLLAFGVALGLAACSGGADVPAGDAPQPVELHRVGASQMDLVQSAAGTVRLRRETPLAFVSDGRVRSVLVREGDQVRAGQLLAALDATAIDAGAEAAAARAKQADAELRRQRDLKEKGWVSQARLDAAVAAAEAARSDLSAARFTQRFATIAAPSAGVVLARLAEPGQTLAAGTPVVTVGELNSGFVVRAPLSAAQAAGLKPGDTADIVFRDGAAPAMAGRVIEVAGRADPVTGTFQVEFAVPANPALRSGLIADVRFRPAAAPSTRIVIPVNALFAARADEGFVWRFDPAKQTVAARMVSLGRVTPDGVELAGGLARGDLIVVSGVDRLVEGQKVRVVAPGAAG